LLTVFGSFSVSLMLLAYWLEPRSNWFVLAFAAGCGLTATYSALAGAYPITAIESIWAIVAVGRWQRRRNAEAGEASRP
jgi:predicted RNA methylase